MSVELIVFLRGEKMPSVRGWARAIRDAGFDVELDTSVDLETHSGMLPCKYKGHAAGFEYYRDEVADTETDAEVAKQIGDRDVVIGFITHGDFHELASSILAASVLCAMSDGVYFDTDAGEFHSARDVIGHARSVEVELQSHLK